MYGEGGVVENSLLVKLSFTFLYKKQRHCGYEASAEIIFVAALI